jgi:hypothetical protein
MLRKEHPVPSWETAVAEDWLGKWAMNQMLINVATRKFARSVRLPEGDVPAPPGAGLTKSAVSRRFVALSAARMKEWMASDLSGLDLLVIQIDGIHMDEDLILVAAIGVGRRWRCATLWQLRLREALDEAMQTQPTQIVDDPPRGDLAGLFPSSGARCSRRSLWVKVPGTRRNSSRTCKRA